MTVGVFLLKHWFHRFAAASLLAAVAWWIAEAIGVPVWRTWEPGDRTDIATCVFAAVMLLTAPTTSGAIRSSELTTTISEPK